MAKTLKEATVLGVIRAAGRRGVVYDPARLCRQFKWDAPVVAIKTTLDGLVKKQHVQRVTRIDGDGKRMTFIVATKPV